MATEKKSTEEKDDDVDFHVIEEKSEPEEKELEKAEKLEAEKIVDEDDEDDEESAESDGERIGADDEDDEELIAKRARRRDEKRLRRERQKAELEDLRNISTSQAKTIEELIANQRKIEAVSIARDLDAIKMNITKPAWFMIVRPRTTTLQLCWKLALLSSGQQKPTQS